MSKEEILYKKVSYDSYSSDQLLDIYLQQKQKA